MPMKTVEISTLIKRDFDLTSVALAYDAHVIPPIPTVRKKGEKPVSRLFLICRGRMHFYEKPGEKQPYLIADTGDILYLPNDVCYVSEWAPGKNGDNYGEYISIQFNVEEDGEILVFSDRVVTMVSQAENVYQTLFSELLSEWNTGALGYRITCKARLYELLKHLAVGTLKSELKEKYSSIYRGILYLENNYLSDVSVKELADMCHVSEGTFRRLFSEYRGISPVHYRNKLRIDRAFELLKSGGYTVSEAAEKVNIGDLAYFSKLFRKFTGTKPSECRGQK